MTATTETTSDRDGRETARHLRGSSVLFAGRMLSLLINMATQVLIVRILTKGDYGIFAYALAFGPGIRTLISVGHHEVLTRFLSLYEERREYDKLFGTIAMKVLTILSGGAFVFVLIFALRDFLEGNAIDRPEAVGLLLLLMWLAPLEAIDDVFESIFAVFSKPRAIFFRKYILTPGIRFFTALALLIFGGSVHLVAAGYLLGSVAGTVAYTWMAVNFFRRQGLLAHLHPRSLVMPFREVFGFSIPLLTTDLIFISMNTVSVILLGHFAGVLHVADYRAVFPVARLNSLVFATFGLMFTPLATRMFARGDRDGMRDAYWHTAIWLAVFTFPVFAVTGPLAEPTTLLLFGHRYENAAVLLAILATGFYFNAALGYNALTLATHGMLGYVVKVNVTIAVLNLTLAFVLIPPYGAMGVVVGNAITLVLQNVLNQIGLRKRVGIPAFDLRYARPYAIVVAMAALLAAVQLMLEPPAVVGFALAAGAAAVVCLLNRDLLAIETTFPEVRRIPLLRRLVAAPETATTR
jgi:O-antigen/teichoic acid export membrane protein